MSFIKNNCYLYHILYGELEFVEGSVDDTPSIFNSAYFISKNHDMPKIACSRQSEEVYEGFVWLPKRDDNRARAALIMYEQVYIQTLRERIDVAERRLKILEGEK